MHIFGGAIISSHPRASCESHGSCTPPMRSKLLFPTAEKGSKLCKPVRLNPLSHLVGKRAFVFSILYRKYRGNKRALAFSLAKCLSSEIK